MKKLITLVMLAALSINSFVASANKPQANPKGWQLNSYQDYNGRQVQVTNIQDLVADTKFGIELKTIYTLFIPCNNAFAKLTITQSADGTDESETFEYIDNQSRWKQLTKLVATTTVAGLCAFVTYNTWFK